MEKDAPTTDAVTAIIESFTSWLAIGDSITVGYNNSNHSYADIIAEKYGIPLTKDAITGTNLSVDSDAFGVAMSGRFEENSDDFSLITVMGGVNDFSHGVTLGEFDPTATTRDTFYNGANVLILGLLKKYPNSKIVFLTSTIDNKRENSLGLKYEDYVIALQTVCNYYSVPFHRIDRLCGFNGDITEVAPDNLYTNDTIHPNTKGHTKIASAISNVINFVNPISLFEKGVLSVSQSTKNIAESDTFATIREILTVKAVYGSVEFELQDYTLNGSIEVGTQEFTVKYRNLEPVNVTFNVGEGDMPTYNVLYKLDEPLTFDGTVAEVSTGMNWINDNPSYTFKIDYSVESLVNSDCCIFAPAYNPSAVVQRAYPILMQTSNRISIQLSDSASGTITDSSGAMTPPPFENMILFVSVDAETSTVKSYMIKYGNIVAEKEFATFVQTSRDYSAWNAGFQVGQKVVGAIHEFVVYEGVLTQTDIEQLI